MATEAVRAANDESFAAAVLSGDLASLVWANEAGAALFGASVPPGPETPDKVLRQLASAGGTLAAASRTQLLLRPADPAFGPAVLARLEIVDVDDTPYVLLTVRQRASGAASLANRGARFLREAGLTDAPACAVFDNGDLVPSSALPNAEHPLLLAQGRAFLDGGENILTVADDDGALSFHRVGHDAVLIHLGHPTQTSEIASPAASELLTPSSSEGVERNGGPVGTPAGDDAPTFEANGIGTILRRWHSRGPRRVEGNDEQNGSRASDMPPPEEPATAEPFRARLDAEPTRFVWRTDADHRFVECPPELLAAVGPAAGDIAGRSFADVSAVFGFGASGTEILRLLDRRDTWSGRSLLWPVEGTDRRAPVDLAGLPVYGRDRAFEGFRGFGVVRPAESVEDAEAIGLALAGSAPPRAVVEPADTGDRTGPPPAIETENTLAFGRRSEPPRADRDAGARSAERRAAREARLSSVEAAAFRAIGAELGAPAPEADDAPTVRGTGFADAFEALPLAILVQAGERLVFGNRRFHELTGYRDLAALEAAGGLDHLVVACGDDGDEHADGRLRHADGSQVSARVHLRRVTLDGRSCLLMSFPTSDAVARAADLAQQRLADTREELAELQAVLDTATDGILLLDEEERLRRMNGAAEALFGTSAERHAGRPFAELLAPESRAAFADYVAGLRDRGMASVLNDGREVVARIGDSGATIPLFVTLGRLGEARGWCVVIRDTAHWKRIEGDLVKARRQAEDASLHKSRFLANVSHELRTPLNAIIGFADVMASECFGPIGHERYIEYLGDIKRSGHHVLDIVNDLLDISKIEAGKVELTFEPVLVNEVVAEVVSLMQPQANRERVLVRSVLPASVPAVLADRRSVRQIALNLIANAVRFTPAGGQIVASTSQGAAGEVTLRIRDSGIGMTDREIEIALAPFQQVPGTGRGGRGEGTGLGLPLTKAMAEANRAAFSIASTPGEGTLVEIVFPPQQVVAQ